MTLDTEKTDLERAKQLIRDYNQEEFGDEPDFDDLTDVGLAFTTITEDGSDQGEEYEIYVSVDLVGCRFMQFLNWKLVTEEKYNSLSELIEEQLEYISWDDLVSVPKEGWEKYHKIASSEYAEETDVVQVSKENNG